MGSKWITRRIGSLGRVVTGKTPSTADSANFGGPYPFITIPDLDGRVFIDHSERTLSKKGGETLRSCLLPAGSVMMSCIATVGKCGVTTKPSFTNQQINSVIPGNDADSRYLYYIFTRLGQELEAAGGGGSVYTNVSKSRFSDIEVDIPGDVSEQKAIAHILGTLDDKIELNRRMNETLEAMARSIFKSWFVNFDPVRAKAAGKKPAGMSDELAALFPDSFQDSELGEIPKGWKVSNIGNEVTTVLGGTPSRLNAAYWNGRIPWINSGKANEFRVIEPSEYISQAGLDCSATKLLPSRTTIIAITGATLGQVSLTEIETCANQSIVGVIGSGKLPSEYLYFWVKENIYRLLACQTGGAQQHINKNNVNDLPVICPPAFAISYYMRLAGPIFDHIQRSCFQSRTLATIRDSLLPKLISGEIRLKNAEKFLEAAHG